MTPEGPADRDAPTVIAASVDVGSTSVHLLAASVRDHEVAPLVDESVFLGLGARVDAARHLGGAARAELAATLAGYAATARGLGASRILFVGTEPLRRAADARRLAAEVRSATGLDLVVASHEEEALLTLLGVTGGRPLVDEVAVVDIGGGSTEIAEAGPEHRVTVRALRLGAARLTASSVAHDPPLRAEIEALRAESRRVVAGLDGGAPRRLVGVGGTASNLLKVVPGALVDRRLSTARLEEALEILRSEPSTAASQRHAINLVRARVLPAGAAILEAILERFGLDELAVVEAGLREGAVLAATRDPIGWRDRLEELVQGWDDSAG